METKEEPCLKFIFRKAFKRKQYAIISSQGHVIKYVNVRVIEVYSPQYVTDVLNND